MTGRRTDPERTADILARYGRGENRQQIARAVGVVPGTVTNVLLRAGITPEKRPHYHECIDRCQAIIDGYALGETMLVLGARFRVSAERVRQILISHHVTFRSRADAIALRRLHYPAKPKVKPPLKGPRRHICSARCEELISRYEAGESSTDIARSWGMAFAGVLQKLHLHGVTIRSRSEGQRLRFARDRQPLAKATR